MLAIAHRDRYVSVCTNDTVTALSRHRDVEGNDLFTLTTSRAEPGNSSSCIDHIAIVEEEGKQEDKICGESSVYVRSSAHISSSIPEIDMMVDLFTKQM